MKVILLLAALAATAFAAKPPGPGSLARYYSAYPAPVSVLQYLDALFTCEGPYTLCSYATCVKVPNSNPPVAECGCYRFNGKSLGAGSGILNAVTKQEVLKLCKGKAKCLTLLDNKASLCKKMLTQYPGYNAPVSTYNPEAWVNATGIAGTPKMCKGGGTVANCFSAACRKGRPGSRFLPPGAPTYNATCYCPYVTTREPFLMSSADYPCGPTQANQVKANTLIYNGL